MRWLPSYQTWVISTSRPPGPLTTFTKNRGRGSFSMNALCTRTLTDGWASLATGLIMMSRPA